MEVCVQDLACLASPRRSGKVRLAGNRDSFLGGECALDWREISQRMLLPCHERSCIIFGLGDPRTGDTIYDSSGGPVVLQSCDTSRDSPGGPVVPLGCGYNCDSSGCLLPSGVGSTNCDSSGSPVVPQSYD